jgi:two-component system phosphate regulon sensor histidine kinase PhoR
MNLIPSRPWQHSMSRLAVWLGLCALLGGIAGGFWIGLCAGLACALGWHYWQLHRLLTQLSGRRRLQPPQGWGVFSEVAERLFQRQREARRRKRRLHGLLRTFRTAAAALPDAVLVVGEGDLTIEWFNEAAVELLGLRPRVDIGKRFTHLVRAPRVSDWLAAGAREPLLDLPSPHDSSRRLSLRLLDYTPRQRLLVVRDISKLMHLEQVRRDFVANVSHELRTPLTVVHGYLDMLEPDEHPEWADLLREMRVQSRRMTQIVEDLLTLSRLEAQERATEEPVDMRSQLASLKREAEALSGGRHPIVINDPCQLDLLGSAKELHSAFSNLVSNAVRYTPPGGRIEIRYSLDPDGSVRLAVIDSGQGIPAQHLPRITERFYRVSNSRSRETGGTGLGLSIVKHVLNLHQAHLEIRSEVGAGSEFACVFAAARGVKRDSDTSEAA